jgi:hypothetical protein
VTHSYNLNVFKEKDPYCFFQSGAALPGEMDENDG